MSDRGLDGLRLARPALDLEAAFLDMVEEYLLAGDSRWKHMGEQVKRDFAGYVNRLEQDARGYALTAGYVPQTSYWLLNGQAQVIGTIRLRHWLTPLIEHEIGHVGYDIRPSQRGKGYGSAQLALLLPEARDMRLKRLLITCDEGNAASARVIEGNGGKLENIVTSKESGERIRRYWIEL